MTRIALATTSVLVLLLGVFPAAANAAFTVTPAKGGAGGNHGHGGGGGGGGSAICGSSTSIVNCGFDVSYPQCPATSLPSPTAFAIVGVNGGLANDYNSCLPAELSWASAFLGLTGQPAVSLYVNTADPGNMYNGQPVGDWPKSSIRADPYGVCGTVTVTVRTRGHSNSYTVGANSAACAWQYGYNMARGDISQVASPTNYPWWLDVETANSWQSSTTMNLSDLEGMVAALPAGVGVYSTSAQWDSIIGTSLTSGSSLYGIPVWIPGASSYGGAQTNCGLPSFTGGTVTLTQWTGTLDSDYFCPTLHA